ncbi:MAG: hypothetical protein HETSPECPRED_001617 [Heterodermia speciosa]|uniref:Uncharacterized protein n=1 Tax=Heterodermia speciosa TaxID=116794 RepID=A0A8H3F3G0_9LECA|nr:MAG: hypothetical protein HETSPECPRED_001617 [Heterodermia speciosa]
MSLGGKLPNASRSGTLDVKYSLEPILSAIGMSLWQKFLNLRPRTRMLIGLGIIGYSGMGILISNGAEKRFGFVANEEEKDRLRRIIPKIRTIDRDEK